MIAFAIVTETIFAWPGTGKLLIDSINQLDRPVIVAYLLVILTLFILIILWSMWCVQSSIHAYAWARNLEEDIEMNAIPATNPPVESPFQRLWSEFAESKLALIGLALLVIIVLVDIFAPLISPQNPYDLGQLDIMDSKLAPGEKSATGNTHLLGTDDQGRDMLSAIFYGLRISLGVGLASTVFALAMGYFLA